MAEWLVDAAQVKKSSLGYIANVGVKNRTN